MHIEVQVALNFVISYLYNKLPRRRVNLFGEELEKALKQKFEGHWYPEKPFKGSAFRCLRIASPIDPVIEQAAQESGVEVADVREHLPDELSVWIDPGEVSYRIGEKGAVKILFSESDGVALLEDGVDHSREVTRAFNPEAQCFKPIDTVTASMGGLSLASPNGTSPTASGSSGSSTNGNSIPAGTANNGNGGTGSPFEPVSTSPTGYKSSATSPIHAFIPKPAAPVTFTTATFAQTKFGSTKLKNSGKRSHRLSPTEFSNYIKQRAAIQQQQQQMHVLPPQPAPQQQQRPRSLSPKPAGLDPFLVMAAAAQSPPFGAYLGDLASPAQFVGTATTTGAAASGGDSKSFLDNMALNSLPYSPQYQHLLMAN